MYFSFVSGVVWNLVPRFYVDFRLVVLSFARYVGLILNVVYPRYLICLGQDGIKQPLFYYAFLIRHHSDNFII